MYRFYCKENLGKYLTKGEFYIGSETSNPSYIVITNNLSQDRRYKKSYFLNEIEYRKFQINKI